MAYKLATGMQVGVQVSYVDAKGHPATVDGDVEWSSSDEMIATVTADAADSTKATVVGVGTVLGIAQVIATADADLGQGVRQIMTTSDVEVVAGKTTGGYELDAERGFVTWKLDIPRGGRAEVDLVHTVHLPKDWKVQ